MTSEAEKFGPLAPTLAHPLRRHSCVAPPAPPNPAGGGSTIFPEVYYPVIRLRGSMWRREKRLHPPRFGPQGIGEPQGLGRRGRAGREGECSVSVF